MIFPPLTSEALTAALPTRWLGGRNVVVDACPSTNDLGMQQGRAGAPEGLVVVSDAQSGGKGRLGRVWHSPAGENLYFSILLRPRRPAVEIPPLTLLAGAAVAQAVAGLGLVPRLKWPNDLLLAGGWQGPPRKAGGILTEMATEGQQVAHVVIGIGLNVNTRQFPAALADKATSLLVARGNAESDDEPIDRLAVLVGVLVAFEAAYERFRAEGPGAAVALWNPYAAIGARCRVRTADGSDVEGVSLGLDPDGALRVRDDDGRVHRVVSGEVTT